MTSVSLQRVWTLVASVLGALSTLPGFARGVMDGPDWGRAFAELRLAEAAARRAIIAMAVARDDTAPPLPSAMPPERETKKGEPSRETAPGPAPFRLSDPVVSSIPALEHGERSAPSEGPAGIVASHTTEGLKARIEALAAVLADPLPTVERCIRLRAWARPHIFSRPRAPQLRSGHPPGYRLKRWMDWDMDILMEIHLLVRKLTGPPPLGDAAPAPCPAA